MTITTPAQRRRPLLTDVVRSELRQAIEAGTFPLGTKLPNEDELCRRYGVSRATLREAVGGLVEDGLVTRRHGSGTYVTRRPVLGNSLDTNFSYTEYLASSGLRAGKELISLRNFPADDECAAALGVEPGTDLIEARRVRTADGRPAIYSIDSIPAALFDRPPRRAAFLGSLYQLLDDHGHAVDHADAVLAPALADRDTARLLNVAVSTPLQYIRQVDQDADGQALMFSREWHAPSVIELRVYRRGPGPMTSRSV